ncbi:unnamed protein product [Ostreobium quekettii]|uniref:Uncharacterized protein n=1 Tax=Ostreobium quekettii TaxID=121088 RepID=A0A8S1IMC2_9CHLO|nr:unnamed protein product [Ostreobium quekettii]
MVEGGFEARQEWEMQQVWNKAMELHHSQRERARNIYAMVHWYSSILAKIEKQEYYEGVTPCPVPPFVRGMFALEEEFEKLNEEQKEVDVLASKYSEILDQVDFYNFVEENLEFSPTELEGRGAGWGNGVLEALRGETHDDEEESDVEEDDEEYDEQEVALGEAKDKGKKALGYELDELLSGIIPNAGSDEEAAEETMSYMKDLLDEGDLTPATVEEPL